jgi:hypothetical protein
MVPFIMTNPYAYRVPSLALHAVDAPDGVRHRSGRVSDTAVPFGKIVDRQDFGDNVDRSVKVVKAATAVFSAFSGNHGLFGFRFLWHGCCSREK